MNLLKLFKAFSINSSTRDAQDSGKEAEISVPLSDPSNHISSRKRRRLHRRPTKESRGASQHKDHISPLSIQSPGDGRKMGFRSAPNLLAEIEDSPSRSWSTIPTIQRQSAPIESHLPLQENIFDGSSCKSHERNNLSPTTSRVSQPFLDEQRGSTLDTPIFGPREEGLFRNEMPYDMVSPLSQLASGWRESPRHSPNSLVFNQHGGPSRQDSASRRSKSPATESPSEWSLRRVPPSRPMDRPVSPELYHDNPVDGTYYIIPGGMDVVFQAEDGREITRVGDFSGRRRRISPIIIQDQYGHELYRTSDLDSSTNHGGEHNDRGSPSRDGRGPATRSNSRRSRSAEIHRDGHSRRSDYGQSEPPTIILIDRNGRHIPMFVRNFVLVTHPDA